MGLPVQLSRRPTAWRTNPFQFSIQCWVDRAKTEGIPLTQFGSTWTAVAKAGSFSAPVAAPFTVDFTQAATGRLVLSMNVTTVQSLIEAAYVFEVIAHGGSLSPLTVFRGTFIVDGG